MKQKIEEYRIFNFAYIVSSRNVMRSLSRTDELDCFFNASQYIEIQWKLLFTLLTMTIVVGDVLIVLSLSYLFVTLSDSLKQIDVWHCCLSRRVDCVASWHMFLIFRTSYPRSWIFCLFGSEQPILALEI